MKGQNPFRGFESHRLRDQANKSLGKRGTWEAFEAAGGKRQIQYGTLFHELGYLVSLVFCAVWGLSYHLAMSPAG
ncbi:hypothetical protein MPNT_460008 [Candidatus Methylacidithermus pantelleriae]|uniref:Uncharacterized protein n=1 Tax=Candidatus Methylacidithermus pantelleriae TaxID=2744239 RepID=A0A8J2FT60_9BACT|nr:hypothetical protein MPNT_460008 [Candidatus Methylacidithermus pantelleriae]